MPALDLGALVRWVPGLIWRALIFIAAVAIVYFAATRWNEWEGEARFQTTDDAYLQQDLTPLSAHVPGYIRAVPVQDFDRVRAGQIVALIVDDDYRATVAQREAGVAAAQAQIETIEAERPLQQATIQAARAVVASTAAMLAQNGRDVRRLRKLLSAGSSSVEATERADTARAQIQAQLRQNRAQADAALRQLGVLDGQEKQAKAALGTAEAQLALARIELGYTRIVAPEDGTIGLRQVLPGQYVGAGSQVTTLAARRPIWVTADYKETQLTRVAVGQSARMTVDTFPGRRLRGHVLALAPASGAQFALLPPDNATGNFTKVVQRVAVKIAIDDDAGLGAALRSGMSAIVTIDTGEADSRATGQRGE